MRTLVWNSEDVVDVYASLFRAGTPYHFMDMPREPLRAQVKIRYLHRPAPATVEWLGNGRVRVVFDEPQRAITPGQAVVFYDGDVVLGGAWIECADLAPTHRSNSGQTPTQ